MQPVSWRLQHSLKVILVENKNDRIWGQSKTSDVRLMLRGEKSQSLNDGGIWNKSSQFCMREGESMLKRE